MIFCHYFAVSLKHKKIMEKRIKGQMHWPNRMDRLIMRAQMKSNSEKALINFSIKQKD